MTTPDWMPPLPQLPKLNARLSATDECALYDWLHQHRLAAVEAYKASRKPVAVITECEACFTPDVCQLRGTCDHYSAEQVRVAKLDDQP